MEEPTPAAPETDSDLHVMSVECPGCHIRHELPTRVHIEFPGDADAIVDLLEGTLNVHRCAACNHRMSLQPPLIVSDSESGTAALSGIDPELLAQFGASPEQVSSGQVSLHHGYAELHTTVSEWTNRFIMRATVPIFSGDEPALGPNGVALADTPLALLVWHEQVEGRMEPRLVTEPPLSEERQREFLSDFYVDHLDDVLGGLYRAAFHGPGLSAFPDLVERRVPGRCLTGPVVERLLGRCCGWDDALLEDFEELSRRLRAEYMNAVAHAVAGRPNPRAGEWAHFAMVLFALGRQANVELPENVVLATEALRRTIRFEDAWNPAAPLLVDRQTVETGAAWFEHLGLEDRLTEHMGAVPVRADLSGFAELSNEELAQRLLDAVRGTGEARVVAVTAMVKTVLRAGRSGAAASVAERELDRLAGDADWETLASQTIRAVEAFREVGENESASTLLRRHLEALDEAPLETGDRVFLYNEIGNAKRYAGDHKNALLAYRHALELAAEAPYFSDRNTFAAQRNIAIVLRELGRFSEAVRLMEELETATRGELSARRAQLLVGLALTYLDAGLPHDALKLTTEAMDVPLSGAEAAVRAHVLTTHARARIGAGQRGSFDEYDQALDLTAEIPALHLAVATMALDTARSGPLPLETQRRAERVLESAVAGIEPEQLDTVTATAVAVLAEHRFSAGDRPGATSLVGPLVTGGLTPRDLPWQINHLIGRLMRETDPELEYVAMREVLDDLDQEVPESSGLAYATPWIGGKGGVQDDIAGAIHRAVARGVADPLDYLDLVDFLCARDIPAVPELQDATPSERLAALAAELPTGVDLALAMFVEHGDDVALVTVDPRAPEPRIDRLDTRRGAFAHVAQRFARAIGPGCVRARQAERAEQLVLDLLGDLGRVLQRNTSEGQQLCLVPSPVLVGFPLHAATASGKPLLERNPIGVAPSPRTLHKTLFGARGGRGPLDGTIVAVPKDGEAPEIGALLSDTADELRARLPGVALEELQNLDATKESCLAAFVPDRQIVFLGHGVEGGSLYGRGMCVSDGQRLPRGPLPVDQIPALRRFVIDAADLERTSTAPEVLVSLACSSGRARAGPGGTRIGLERSLFANGARTIIAPLWDVDVESALGFILMLYESWREEPRLTLGEHHRRATLALREQYPLLYHWGPFALNGSFQ